MKQVRHASGEKGGKKISHNSANMGSHAKKKKIFKG